MQAGGQLQAKIPMDGYHLAVAVGAAGPGNTLKQSSRCCRWAGLEASGGRAERRTSSRFLGWDPWLGGPFGQKGRPAGPSFGVGCIRGSHGSGGGGSGLRCMSDPQVEALQALSSAESGPRGWRNHCGRYASRDGI